MEKKVINLDRFVPRPMKISRRLLKTSIRHGLSDHPDHGLWRGLFVRCYNPKNKIYKYYGGRGIKVCERWNNFKNFIEDMGPRPKGFQLDRVNNDGDYEPSNCRWVTPRENNPSIKGDLKDDMPGKRFGKWLVGNRVKHLPGHWYYSCVCDCGTIKINCGGEMRRGKTTQCMQCKNKEHSYIHTGWLQRKLNAVDK